MRIKVGHDQRVNRNTGTNSGAYKDWACTRSGHAEKYYISFVNGGRLGSKATRWNSEGSGRA